MRTELFGAVLRARGDVVAVAAAVVAVQAAEGGPFAAASVI